MTTIAVIKTGGKQYKVAQDELIMVEKLPGEVGDKIEFEALLIGDDAKQEIGTPSLEKKIIGEIVEQTFDPKITVIKFRAKSKYRRKHGHWQAQTKVKITKI